MRLIDADLFMQRIESYNTLDEKDKALYNFALHEIVCMPTVDVFDKIRAEIEQNAYPIVHGVNNHEKGMTLYGILQIIDKYREDKWWMKRLY